MNYEIIGIRKTEFDTKDGKHIGGYTFYVTYTDGNVNGYATDKFFLSDSKMINRDISIKVGDKIRIYYNKYGKVEYVNKE